MRSRVLLLLVIIINFAFSQSASQVTKIIVVDAPKNIDRFPSPSDFSPMHHQLYQSIEETKKLPRSPFLFDLRSADLSLSQLNDAVPQLFSATFDSRTRWPKILPKDFDPKKVIELGKNPGLGIRDLHKEGINGHGIGIAIVDSSLLVEHDEYNSNLRLYSERHLGREEQNASMHGSAVASIAVGHETGVAPGANLYYFAETDGVYEGDKWIPDLTYLAKTILRIIKINRRLPIQNKIRVISFSSGWESGVRGYKLLMDSIHQAERDHIFFISSNLSITSRISMKFQGLGREPYADPDDPHSYRAGHFWERTAISTNSDLSQNLQLIIPMDSRCVASPTGRGDYVFYRSGGWSWVIPYLAGLYTLACQVDPGITPEKFWTLALKTGYTIPVDSGETSYVLKFIPNPKAIINCLSAKPL